jgi:hypothetical protein
MGTYSKGILGPFSGKVGTVVGSDWNGISVIRSAPGPRKGEGTAKQLEQQQKFGLMIKFLQPVTSLLNVTFNRISTGMTSFNKAMSYNLLNAIKGVYPDFSIDYSMALLSRGDLPNAPTPTAASAAAGKLTFTWTDNSGIGKAQADDKAFIAAYSEELEHWIYIQGIAARNAGTATVDAPAFSGRPAQTYLGFQSANGKFVTNSAYTGAVNVL